MVNQLNVNAHGRVHKRYFGDYYPAMTLFEVTGFFQTAALIECEGFTWITESKTKVG